jgi:hypothetical protein
VEVVRVLLPLALAAYFLWRARTNRLFLLGIPFLQMMRYSVFFENARPFWMPGRLGPIGAMMLWLVIAWLFCTGALFPGKGTRRSGALFGPPLRLPEEGFVLALAAMVFAQVIVTWVSGVDPFEVVSQGAGLICACVGYFLVRGCVYQMQKEAVASFLKALVVVTILAAALFIVHQALHLRVYLLPEYISFTFAGTVLTRTYVFMPPLLIFAGAWLMARRRFDLTVSLGLVTIAVAVVTSYTRILIAAFLVELFVVFLLTWIRSTRLGRPFMNRFARWAVGAAVLVTVLALVFPVGTQYAISRIGPVANTSGVSADVNFRGRADRVSLIGQSLGDNGVLLGGGFRRIIGGLNADLLQAWSSDMGWIQVMYWLGVLGLALLFGAFAMFVVRASRLALAGDPWWSAWGVTWAAALLGAMIAVLASWSFLWPTQLPLAFWMLAFVAACRPKVAVSGRDRSASLAGAPGVNDE